jgi:hypothetical protein
MQTKTLYIASASSTVENVHKRSERGAHMGNSPSLMLSTPANPGQVQWRSGPRDATPYNPCRELWKGTS